MKEEFYIGYVEKAPRRLAKWLIAISSLLLVYSAAVGIMLVVSQDQYDASEFEFGSPISVVGVYSESPVPNLVSIVSGRLSEQYVLVSEGKHGTPREMAALDGEVIELSGTRIYREGMMMLELTSDPVSESNLQRPPNLPESESLGPISLQGEIVDSKCFLGVMNPGAKTVHRACAELCIRGGIPPLLVVHDTNGGTWMAILTGSDGEAINHNVLPYIAQPVQIEGELISHGTLHEIRLDPDSIQRLR